MKMEPVIEFLCESQSSSACLRVQSYKVFQEQLLLLIKMYYFGYICEGHFKNLIFHLFPFSVMYIVIDI